MANTVPQFFYKHPVPTRLPPGQRLNVSTAASEQNGRFFAEPDGDRVKSQADTLPTTEEMVNVTGQFNNLTSSGFSKLPASEPRSPLFGLYFTESFVFTSATTAPNPDTAQMPIKGPGTYTITNDNPAIGGQDILIDVVLFNNGGTVVPLRFPVQSGSAGFLVLLPPQFSIKVAMDAVGTISTFL